MTEPFTGVGLSGLPAELVILIFSYLNPADLANVAQTCKAFAQHSYDESNWQRLVNINSSIPIKTSEPLKSFRELYAAQHPYWFVLKHRIWFSDSPPYGKLLLSRYEPSTGKILAYTVLARRGSDNVQLWEKDRRVIIHSFDPQVSLHLRRPEVKLDIDDSIATTTANEGSSKIHRRQSWRGKERLMDTLDDAGLYASFVLCRTLPEAAITEGTQLWPPLRIPAATRTRNLSGDEFNSLGHRPLALDQISESNFRIRKWAEFTGRQGDPQPAHFTSPNGIAAAIEGVRERLAGRWRAGVDSLSSIRRPEDVTTYATLPASSYTPTAEKPWQGIWCGDYSGHGCEFLLIQQPDIEDERPLPDGMHWLHPWFGGVSRRSSANSTSSYSSAQEQLSSTAGSADANASNTNGVNHEHAEPPCGRLEAIKLTGDPNIPRGEYTFIAPDIGPRGLIRIADEELFRGARVVRSAGHIAHRNFTMGEYRSHHTFVVNANSSSIRSIHALSPHHDFA